MLLANEATTISSWYANELNFCHWLECLCLLKYPVYRRHFGVFFFFCKLRYVLGAVAGAQWRNSESRDSQQHYIINWQTKPITFSSIMGNILDKLPEPTGGPLCTAHLLLKCSFEHSKFREVRSVYSKMQWGILKHLKMHAILLDQFMNKFKKCPQAGVLANCF